jgi:pimeloyl-ACP methyl ester carboxylesterase
MIQQNIDLNPIGGMEPMQLIKKEGVTLAYQDINPGSPPMLFVHGWGCDHTAFAPQAEFSSRSHLNNGSRKSRPLDGSWSWSFRVSRSQTDGLNISIRVIWTERTDLPNLVTPPFSQAAPGDDPF